ncbi:Fatty acid synthase subunit beta [Fusarium oxysporum f. sp. conglutinans]|nr:Fatty acid synthase subunit beta [Fusarium oxysporum f. sp. conglutinans]
MSIISFRHLSVFPLIGLVQLAHYEVTCKVLGVHPGMLRERITGSTGHSQGIVMAAATAAADSWDSWRYITSSVLTMLFWIGTRSQQAFPITSMTPNMLRKPQDHGEGAPTPMLSIRDLPQAELQKHIDATNQYLPEDRHVSISLLNSPRNLVVTGPPTSLYGLHAQLRKIKAPIGLDQSRIPFTERKVRFAKPIPACHCTLP